MGGHPPCLAPDAFAEVIAGHIQIVALGIASTDQHVHMGMNGVVVRGGNPFEWCAEVGFHTLDEVAGKGHQIEPVALLRGDNHPEDMAIVFRTLDKGLRCNPDGVLVEELWPPSVSASPVAFQIAEMRMGLPRSGNAHLHHDTLL
jgi:hypothetical protein